MSNNTFLHSQPNNLQNQEKGQKTRKTLGDLRQDKMRF
jgi:hypothetical protein